MSKWTFITNHGAVLSLLAQNGQIPTREIAIKLGITERSVYRIISELEDEGYIEKTSEGALNRYRVYNHLPLRQPGSRDVSVGHLLRMLDRWG